LYFLPEGGEIVLGQFAEANFGEGVLKDPDLHGAGIDGNNLSTLGFEHLQSILAALEHRVEEYASIGLDSPLDRYFVCQRETEEMNAPSFANALIVQTLGGCGGGIQGRITRGAGEIVLRDSEAVG
jgi:hypothetical protein